MQDATASLPIKHIKETLPYLYSSQLGRYSALLWFGFIADIIEMANDNLGSAKKAKNDEFYTQYHDIEKEMNAYLEYNKNVFKNATVLLPCDDPEWSNFTKYFAQNFKRLGLKKLISTSYAPGLKSNADSYQPPLFELESPQYDEEKAISKGKIFVLDSDTTGDGEINIEDIKWGYLEGNGDFRSEEVKRLRNEATHIITNPPFSLFREFMAWIIESKKKFSIIGNINAITYKEVFPLLKDNKIWLGPSITSGDREFSMPLSVVDLSKFTGKIRDGIYYQKVVGVRWFTNIDHGRRHQPIILMTGAENIKFSKHKNVRGLGYQKYDNYDAIEVPFVDAIPSDYKGIMGVPISLFDKYNPDQFEILGSQRWEKTPELIKVYKGEKTAETDFKTLIAGKETYDRIFIKHKTEKGNK